MKVATCFLQTIKARRALTTLISLAVIALTLLISQKVSAVNRTWDGGGADNNWSTAGNWSGDAVPVAGDIAIYDGTSNKPCTIDAGGPQGANINLSSIQISSGYAGTITQTAGVTLTLSSYVQSGGTFTGGSGNIDVNSGFSLSGGTFTSTTGTLFVAAGFTHTGGGTFVHNEGTVEFDGFGPIITVAGSETFKNLSLNAFPDHDSQIAVNSALVVTGTLSMSEGFIRNLGGVGTPGMIEARAGVIHSANFDGGDSIIRITQPVVRTITLQAPGKVPTLTLATSDVTIETAGAGTITGTAFNLEAGVVQQGSVPLSFTGAYNQSGGTYTGGSVALTVAGSFTLSSGSFSKTTGVLTTSSFSQSGGTFTGGSGHIDINGSGFSLSGGTFTSTSGTLFVTAGFTHTAGGAFVHNEGTVEFDGFGADITVAGSETFKNLSLNAFPDHDSRIAVNSTLVVTGTLSMSEGYIRNLGGVGTPGMIEARAGVLHSANFDGGDSIIRITQPVVRTITLQAPGSVPTLTLATGDVTIETAGAGTITGTAFNLEAGVVQQGSVPLSFTGAYNQSGGTYTGGSVALTVAGSFTLSSGSFSKTTGVLTTSSFSQSGGTFTGGSGHIDINGSGFSLSGGTFTSTTGTLFVAAGFAVGPAGSFEPNNGKVEFDGTGVAINVTGSESFQDVSFNAFNDFNTTIAASDTLIVTGTVTFSDGIVSSLSTGSPGTVSAQGNVVVASSFDGGTAAVTFSESANQTFTNNGGVNPTGTWTVSKTAGKVTLLSNLILNTSTPLNITSGEFNQGPSGTLTSGAVAVGVSGVWRNFGSGDITLGGNVSNTGLIEVDGDGTTCEVSNSVLIRSSVSGTRRNWTGTGVFSFQDVDVKDQGGTASITVFSGTDAGNNAANWIFNGGCSPVKWDGGGATNNFSEAANWTRDSIPASGDTIVFDGTSTKNAIIDFNIAVNGIRINSGYSGAISQNPNTTFTVGGDSFVQNTGTFSANFASGSSSVIVNSDVTINGGVFEGGGSNSTVDINGNLSINNSTFAMPVGILSVSGNLTLNAGSSFQVNGTIIFDGANPSTITLPANEQFINAAFAKSNGIAATIANSNTLIINGSLSLSDGQTNGGALEARGSVNVGGSFDGGTTNLNITGGAQPRTATFNAGAVPPTFVGLNDANATLNSAGSGSLTFQNFVFQSGVVQQGPVSFVFNNDYSQSSGSFNGGSGSLTINGSFDSNGGVFNASSGSVVISGLATIDGAFNGGSGSIQVGSLTQQSSTITLSTGSLTVSGTFAQDGGTFTGGAGNINLMGDFNQTSGQFSLTGGILSAAKNFQFQNVFNHTGGAIILHGQISSTLAIPKNQPIKNLTIDKTNGAGVSLSSTVIVTDELNLNDGPINGGTLEARGNVTLSNNFDGGSAELKIANGSAARTVTLNAGVIPPNTVTLADANATLNTTGNGNISFQSLNFSAGAVAQGAVNFTFNSGYAQTGGTYNGGSGNIDVNGGFAQSGGTYNGESGNIDINGGFILNGGTFQSSSGILSISGSFNAQNGAFIHNGGTVLLDASGNTSISFTNPSTVVFNNFTFATQNTSQISSGCTLKTVGTLRFNQGNIIAEVNFPVPIEAQGDVIVQNDFSQSRVPIAFTGSFNQTLTLASGSIHPFCDLTVDKPAGTLNLAGGDLSLAPKESPCNDRLDLVNGTITTGSHAVHVTDVNYSILRTNGYIIGNLRYSLSQGVTYSFPVGTANGYSPVQANVTAVTGGAATLAVSATEGVHSAMSANPTLSRYWTVTESGSVTANLTFNYLQADVNASHNEGSYSLVRIENNTPDFFASNCPAGPVCINTTDNIATIDNVPEFSDWTLGQPGGTQLGFRVQPSNTAVSGSITPAVEVAVQDQFGNTITSATNAITIAIGNNPGGGTLAGTLTRSAVGGVAIFNDLSINNLGTGYTLVATSGVLTQATSSPFNVVGPTQLAFTVHPVTTPVNTSISPSVRVAILDQFGNTFTNATNPVTIAVGNNPTGGTLSGTLTRNAVGGVATFNDLSINNAGNGYTLVATSGALAQATSSQFNIVGPTQLAFTVQPVTTPVNTSISPAVRVAILDQFGNTVTGATNAVTIAIGNNPAGGSLSGILTQNAVSGIATFSDLSINNAGNSYTLVATSGTLTQTTSSQFNIVGPTQLAFTVQPVNTLANANISPAVRVAILDQFGNTVASATNPVTIAIGNNPSAGTLSGTLTRDAVGGIAIFNDLRINVEGIGYSLLATSNTLASATSNPFNIVSQFVVTNTNGSGGGSLHQAILNANTTPGMQTISFDIPGTAPFTIATSLPIVLEPTIIDGTTQPGFAGSPIIELQSLNPSVGVGVTIIGGNSTIKGLCINRYAIGIHAGGPGNVIKGNYIGVDITGNSRIDMMSTGVWLANASNTTNNTIGGTNSGDRNVIVGLTYAILMNTAASPSTNNVIQGNFLGTNAAGTVGLAGGISTGIGISSNNTIGGTSAGAGNLISGNGTALKIFGNGNSIQGNLIGTDAGGLLPLANQNQNGITVGGSDNIIGSDIIGGIDPGAGNTIAFNITGIAIPSIGTRVRNTIRGNSIHSNSLLGIDLSANGVAFNDKRDPDAGGNNTQNYPCVTFVATDGAVTRIVGNFDSVRSQQFTIDFYSSPTCDASDWGEGKTYIGSTQVTMPFNDFMLFDITLPVASTVGHFITSTATDSQGNTSEFSRCIYIAPSVVSISGKLIDGNGVTLKNAQVFLSQSGGGGSSLPSTITDDQGNYTFNNVATGLETLVKPVHPNPVHQNYTFDPTSIRFVNLDTDKTEQNFSFTQTKYSIKGELNYSTPLSDVKMTLSGATGRTMVVSTNYEFSGLNPNTTYTVTPSKDGYVFSPLSFDVTIANSDEQRDFTATASSPLEGRLVFVYDSVLGSINADGSAYRVFSSQSTTHSATLSRDGKKIVTSRSMTGTSTARGLFLRDADGSNETQLLAAAGSEQFNSPSWSPDSTRVAFVRNLSGTRTLRVRNADGSVTIISSALPQLQTPTWLSNSRLVFSAFDGNDLEIYAVNTNGTGLTKLTNNSSSDVAPSASPDGTKIAFVDSTLFIRVMNAANGQLIATIGSSNLPINSITWSPDGTRVCYVKSTSLNSRETVAVNASDGSGLRIVRNGSLDSLSWGPDYEFATPTGNNVRVPPVGGGGAASVTFNSVAAAGTTTFAPASYGVGPLPNGFVTAYHSFHISTTAAYVAPVTVCFKVPNTIAPTQPAFDKLSLMHSEGGVVADITTNRNFATLTICGTAITLGSFGLAEQVGGAGSSPKGNLPSITGLVQDSTGNPLSDVIVQLEGAESRTTQTDHSGIFRFVNLTEGGNYNVQPKQLGYFFDLNSRFGGFINLSGENTIVITGTQGNFSISGRALDENGNGVSGVQVSLEGATSGFATTDNNGDYVFTDLPADGAFFITAFKDGFGFTPVEHIIDSLTNDQTEVNFIVGAPTCVLETSASSQFFLMNGGPGSVNVTTGSACSWTAAASDSWITIVSEDNGTGNGVVDFEVRENFTGSARQTTINVSGQLLTIVQDAGLGDDCGYSISPGFESFSAAGGSGLINVNAEERCAWQAVSSDPWVTITSAGVGISNGTVSYAVAPNPGPAGRAASITIGGKVFAVKQKAP